jgi:hypothetical protein
MSRALSITVLLSGLWGFSPASVVAGEIEYPQIIKTRYEAVDPKAGGQFVLWSERERIFYGLDPKLFPAAQYVEVTQVTPSVGSITLTYVEVKPLGSRTPDYLYLTGSVRFRISGMVMKSSNFPATTGMVPKPEQ